MEHRERKRRARGPNKGALNRVGLRKENTFVSLQRKRRRGGERPMGREFVYRKNERKENGRSGSRKRKKAVQRLLEVGGLNFKQKKSRWGGKIKRRASQKSWSRSMKRRT